MVGGQKQYESRAAFGVEGEVLSLRRGLDYEVVTATNSSYSFVPSTRRRMKTGGQESNTLQLHELDFGPNFAVNTDPSEGDQLLVRGQ